jgi:hypothetical protein
MSAEVGAVLMDHGLLTLFVWSCKHLAETCLEHVGAMSATPECSCLMCKFSILAAASLGSQPSLHCSHQRGSQ